MFGDEDEGHMNYEFLAILNLFQLNICISSYFLHTYIQRFSTFPNYL